MPLPDLLTVGLIVFCVSFVAISLTLYLKRNQIRKPRRITEKIGTVIAFSVAIATASFFGINALYYGITLQPYPGESLDTGLRASIVFGAAFLIWFAVKSVLDEFDKFFESAEEDNAKPRNVKKLEPKPSQETTQAGTKISVTVQLPTARWGEPNSVKVDVEQSKTVGDLVSKAMQQIGPLPDTGPLFVVAGQIILGPQDYSKPILTSGIQNEQTVILTDKPPPKPFKIIPGTTKTQERASPKYFPLGDSAWLVLNAIKNHETAMMSTFDAMKATSLNRQVVNATFQKLKQAEYVELWHWESIDQEVRITRKGEAAIADTLLKEQQERSRFEGPPEETKVREQDKKRRETAYRMLKGLLEIIVAKSPVSKARFSEPDLQSVNRILAENHDVLDPQTLELWDAKKPIVREGSDTLIDISQFYSDVNMHYERFDKRNPYHNQA